MLLLLLLVCFFFVNFFHAIDSKRNESEINQLCCCGWKSIQWPDSRTHYIISLVSHTQHGVKANLPSSLYIDRQHWHSAGRRSLTYGKFSVFLLLCNGQCCVLVGPFCQNVAAFVCVCVSARILSRLWIAIDVAANYGAIETNI